MASQLVSASRRVLTAARTTRLKTARCQSAATNPDLVEVFVDDKPVYVEPGTTVLQVRTSTSLNIIKIYEIHVEDSFFLMSFQSGLCGVSHLLSSRNVLL